MKIPPKTPRPNTKPSGRPMSGPVGTNIDTVSSDLKIQILENKVDALEHILSGTYEVYKLTNSYEDVGIFIIDIYKTYISKMAKNELQKL